MRQKFTIATGLLFLITNAFAQTSISPGEVYGNWGISGSPYLIQGDIVIPNDSTLTIEPGVTVEFQGYYGLDVQGRLLAVGNASQNISFTVNDTTGFYNSNDTLGGWNGIQFIDTPPENDTSKIIFCSLQYGKAVDTIQPGNSGGAVFIRNFSKVIISNCLISYNSAGGSDSPSGGGLCLQFADIIISGNEFSHNSAFDGGGIQIWESNPVFTGNTIKYNTAGQAGGGIWIGGQSNPVFNGDIISNNTAIDNGGGIICWQTTNTVLNSVNLNGNSGFNGGGLCLIDCEILINECNITNNSSAWIGGGINAYSCLIEISSTYFERDTAALFGGAMSINYSQMTINNSGIVDNRARTLGGGIHSDFSTININNTLFERDTTDDSGGGIFTWHCDLTINECEFSDNSAVGGGAICFDSSSVIITNSNFNQNTAIWGAGISSNRGALHVQDCIYANNTSEHGGAVYSGFSNIELINNTFEQNHSIWGGGISTLNSNLVVDSCLFSENTVSSEAGAIECIIDTANFTEKVSIQIINSDFVNNAAENLYGGVEIRQVNSDTSLCSVMMDKNIFRENSAYSYSAIRFIGNIDNIEVGNSIFENNYAIQPTSIFSANGGAKVKVYNTVFAKNNPRAASLNANSRIDFINCSFIGNSGSERSALSLRNNAEATVTNSIFWDNGNNIFSLITVGGNGNTLTINYSDLQYGPDSIYVSDSLSVVNWGTGNIDLYPLFADTLNNDYHLQSESPCITAGTDSIEIAGVWYYCPATDIEGNPRPNPAGSRPDMGAYESQYPVGIKNDISTFPTEFALYQNYPNPFNPVTKIKYQIPRTTYVKLIIFNVLGREVETLVDGVKSAGFYEPEFNASRLSSGVYFYRLKADNYTETRKMILMK